MAIYIKVAKQTMKKKQKKIMQKEIEHLVVCLTNFINLLGVSKTKWWDLDDPVNNPQVLGPGSGRGTGDLPYVPPISQKARPHTFW